MQTEKIMKEDILMLSNIYYTLIEIIDLTNVPNARKHITESINWNLTWKNILYKIISFSQIQV